MLAVTTAGDDQQDGEAGTDGADDVPKPVAARDELSK
jgi:hypothetical protein